jgi:hypothetical protein
MREDQLERSLRASAPHVSTVGVLEQVAHRRERRSRARRARVASVAALVLAVTIALAVVATDDNDTRTHVATSPSDSLHARVVHGAVAAISPESGSSRAAVPIALDPDQGYIRGPLHVTGSTLSFAAYDRDGSSFRFPPSRIVRVDSRSGHEQGRVDLRAEVLSVADGEGARWALTRNPAPASGLPDAFLKRITADGEVTSVLLPPGSNPVGPIVVGQGAVWVPLRDAVLRYDAATARATNRYALPPADTRSVAVTDQIVATDRADLVALQPAGLVQGISAGTFGDNAIVAVTSTASGELVRLTVDPADRNRFSVEDERLPAGFVANSVTFAGRLGWVAGTAGEQPAVVLLDEAGVMRGAVVLDDAHDVSFAWVDRDTVLATADGRLVRIDVTR